MRRIGVDSNVVVSFVTDRNAAQLQQAAELFGGAAEGQHVVVVPHSVISESVYVLGNVYGVTASTVSSTMNDLLSLAGVMAVDDADWPIIWNTWPRHIKDFGDACVAAVGRAGAFDALATFDLAFAKQVRRQGLAIYW